MFKKFLTTVSTLAIFATAADAAAITWGAGIDNGFSAFDSSELGIGNYALLGTFDITDAVIQLNQFDLAFLKGHFTQFDAAQIGQGLIPPVASNFTASVNLDTTAFGGLQLYYWVFNSTNNSTATTSFNSAFQQGIFYLDKAVNNIWATPIEAPAASTTVDLSDLTNAAGNALAPGAHVVLGSFPTGTSSASGSPNFGLVPTPEPSSVMLLGAGALGLLARRRRNS